MGILQSVPVPGGANAPAARGPRSLGDADEVDQLEAADECEAQLGLIPRALQEIFEHRDAWTVTPGRRRIGLGFGLHGEAHLSADLPGPGARLLSRAAGSRGRGG